MIVIPSFERYEKIQKHTLSYLKSHNIPDNKICIVISEHDNQLEDYLTLPYNILITDANKIGQVHNFITDTFEEDEFIIELDDDIRNIIDKDLKPILNFATLCDSVEHLLRDNQCSYAGTYAVDNKMFMNKSKEMTWDLRYCLGLIRFRIIRKEIKCETNYSEDFENCILHYLRDGKLLRLNHICGRTQNYSKGGCDGTGRNIETEKIDKEFLANKYPDLTTLFQRKNLRWDLKLKDTNKNNSTNK